MQKSCKPNAQANINTFKHQNNSKQQASNPMQTRYYSNPNSCNASFRSTEQDFIEKGTCTTKFIPTLCKIGCRLGEKIVIRQFFWHRGRFLDVLWRRGSMNKEWLLRERQFFYALTGVIEEEKSRINGWMLASGRRRAVGRAVRWWIFFPDEESSVSDDWTGDGDIRKRVWDNNFRILILWD